MFSLNTELKTKVWGWNFISEQTTKLQIKNVEYRKHYISYRLVLLTESNHYPLLHKIVKIWTTVSIIFLRWKYYTTENMCITSKRVTQNYHLYLWSAAWFGSRLSTQNTLSQHEGNEIIFKIFKKYLSCSAGGL